MKTSKPDSEAETRYAASALLDFAINILQHAGLSENKAKCVAEILLEGDLMGHTTHGMQMLAPYLKNIETGAMATDGEPEVIADNSSAITWNGKYLPGPWLMLEALNLVFERVQSHPVVTLVMQHCHHIGCLAAYSRLATDKGLYMMLTCSDPSVASIAPYGGIEPLYTPNPLAVAIPTQGSPIIIDISLSCTSNGLVMRLNKLAEKLPHPWLLDNRGHVTDEPSALFDDPPGSILPLGGEDLGYKGFGLGLMVEALTAGLSGHGRKDRPTRWGASVFVQVIDPEAFGGIKAFVEETEFIAEASRKTKPKPGGPPVRLPGGQALALREKQLRNGVVLNPVILPFLFKWSDKLKVPFPKPFDR
jgi:L-lactate dehydrogenase